MTRQIVKNKINNYAIIDGIFYNNDVPERLDCNNKEQYHFVKTEEKRLKEYFENNILVGLIETEDEDEIKTEVYLKCGCNKNIYLEYEDKDEYSTKEFIDGDTKTCKSCNTSYQFFIDEKDYDTLKAKVVGKFNFLGKKTQKYNDTI